MRVFIWITIFLLHSVNGLDQVDQLNSTVNPPELQKIIEISGEQVMFKKRVNINFNEFQVECIPPSGESISDFILLYINYCVFR